MDGDGWDDIEFKLDNFVLVVGRIALGVIFDKEFILCILAKTIIFGSILYAWCKDHFKILTYLSKLFKSAILRTVIENLP